MRAYCPESAGVELEISNVRRSLFKVVLILPVWKHVKILFKQRLELSDMGILTLLSGKISVTFEKMMQIFKMLLYKVLKNFFIFVKLKDSQI